MNILGLFYDIPTIYQTFCFVVYPRYAPKLGV